MRLSDRATYCEYMAQALAERLREMEIKDVDEEKENCVERMVVQLRYELKQIHEELYG